MKKNLFAVVNALLAAAILFGCWYCDRHGTLQLKGTVSLLFMLLGAVNAAYAFLSRCEKKTVFSCDAAGPCPLYGRRYCTAC